MHMEVCVRIYDRLTIVARQAGYGSVSEEWCEKFLEAASRDGSERSVKDSLRNKHDRLNRGWKKKFISFYRILIVFEGKRPVDCYPLEHVQNQILLPPDSPPTGRVGAEAFFAVAVSIQLYSKVRTADKIRNLKLSPKA